MRLAEDLDRQLSWARGSSLSRMTGDLDAVGAALAAAHRTARESVTSATLPDLDRVAMQAGDAGVDYGAQIQRPLTVAIDARSLNVGSGSLGLNQADGVPVRSAGLGSRRLLALAIQKQTLNSSVVTLVDEIEHGLEPHRLRHLLNKLRRDKFQVLMTSHSETVVAELGVDGLGIVRRDAVGAVTVRHPDVLLQAVVRGMPEARAIPSRSRASGLTTYAKCVIIYAVCVLRPFSTRSFLKSGRRSSLPCCCSLRSVGFSRSWPSIWALNPQAFRGRLRP